MAKQDTASLQTRIDREVALQFKELAEVRGVSEAQLLREVVTDYIENTDVDSIAEEIRRTMEKRIARLTRKK
ncbi:hypothetical protein [Dietzia natronolimnaea]|uniref:hypothetical protein n=1 Tax=Dietzia natronolimnaea TaxID=161920 RepID=UPI0015FE5A93|nr:hypothetical protein [Dietzia natronolimnaea]MBB1037344.1 hypothetical protein [Dietzia natronolimnaea]